MPCNLKDRDHCTIRSSEGAIGKVKDLYFDDDAWVICYFVLHAGSWLPGRSMLILPISVNRPDWHLRSCNAVTGYRIHATDGEIGHGAGFLVDEDAWAVRDLVIDTRCWWIGHRTLIAPPWIKGVHWAGRTVLFHCSRDAVKDGPT